MPSFYKLVTLENRGVTLEIDGVRMHQSKNKVPMRDAVDKVRLVGLSKGSVVLDVCTGLGYCAIACVDKGASKVITLEKDDNVLRMARQNPESKNLFSDPRINVVNGDALVVLPELKTSYFDYVFHDPPRFSLAGELYSLSFYEEIYRVLKPGGRLFHYVGNPGSKAGKNLPKGVKQRLLQAGFTGIRWVDTCLGFLAVKTWKRSLVHR